ncbi:mid2 like cell wall stress sensor domain-containing protein [Pochonia chlamydosporia 170]|uniref:Mid2 like cell wall stress sensor domain-containing protein n=1 Tax=Pochonia chlamydosporia 170 TaxID=1380566 RepID=A0A179G4U8_METCM|nr:mid2 like cell wall stress sensor domain-containing protein [Pochonia chlamydosporia 170]OAQ72179.1 mid2 like cell wall stress sensor domain-containing protein [Pochonia chlamydosporia 170]
MARLPPHLRLLLLATVVSANPTPPLFARDGCATSGPTSCAAQGLAKQLCCPADSACVALAGKTTVICCPSNQSCNKIQPITCNLAEQDPSLNPNAPIKTTVKNAKLPTCGTNLCCPFGFTCSPDKTSCTMDQDQSKSPESSPSASPTRATLTSTTGPAPTATTTNTSTAAATTSADANQDHGSSGLGPEKISIIGGAVGGVLALCLLIGIIFLCVRSRSKKGSYQRSSSRDGSAGSGPYGNMISGPILNPETSYRTDFIRKPPSPPSPAASRFSRSLARLSRAPRLSVAHTENKHFSIRNPFHSPNPSVPSPSPRMSQSSLSSHDDDHPRTGHVGARLPPIRNLAPDRHSQYAHRDYSRESITVHAGPDTVPKDDNDNRTTTFGGLMRNYGDVHQNNGYTPGSQTLQVPGARRS